MTMDIKEAITLENKAFRADNEISPPKMSLFGIPKGLGVLLAITVVHRDDLTTLPWILGWPLYLRNKILEKK